MKSLRDLRYIIHIRNLNPSDRACESDNKNDVTVRCFLVIILPLLPAFYKKEDMRSPSAPLWRTKKSHFRPSDEIRMKNVDKDDVNTTIGLICYLDS